MKRIGLTLIALLILLLAGWFFGRPFQAETPGSLTIILVDHEEEVRRDVTLYHEGESLYDILSRNYEISCASPTYEPDPSCEPLMYSEVTGRILLEIESLKSNWKDTFIQIQINGIPAVYGMDQVKFNDQDEIRLVLRTVE